MSFLHTLAFILCWLLCPARPGPALQHPGLVEQFYRQRRQELFWFTPGETAAAFRRQLLSSIDSATWQGLYPSRYPLRQLQGMEASETLDSSRLAAYDRFYTDAAFTFCNDLLQGAGVDSLLSFDGVSPTHRSQDEKTLVEGLSRLVVPADFKRWTDSLQPATPSFTSLKEALHNALDSGEERRCRQLAIAMNTWRRICHYHFDRFIVVNIPSLTLRCYSADTLALSMKIVAGQPSKRTPRFAAFCRQLILYPYWNIPHKIAVRELLPLFRKEPGLSVLMNIEALDGRGKKADITKIPWSSYSADNFPYSLRQAPGCDNALGVLKFDMVSPYDVYMHDTNVKKAFASSWRYLSHGCIRLERPFELGNLLLDNRLDTAYLRSCFRDQQPVPISLEQPVPVFVIYLTADTDATGRLSWYKDIYHLLH